MPTTQQIQAAAVAEQVAEQKVEQSQQTALDQQTQTQQELLESIQAQQAQQQAQAQPLLDQAQQAQAAQLGLLGQPGGDVQAAQNVLSSPLVQAINQQNQQNIQAQAAASGVSGGNLLTALQDANTGTILQAGLGGLGAIAGQSGQLGLGLGGLAQNTFGLGVNQAQNLGQAQLANTLFQGQQAAAPLFGFSQGIQQQQQDLGTLIGLASNFAGLGAPAQPAAATSGVVQSPVRPNAGSGLLL